MNPKDMFSDRLALAIDIGGTFTDLVLLDLQMGRLAVAKILTSYPDPTQAVLEGVRSLLDGHQVSADHVERLIHGTTLVTNTLIERKGAATGLITTAGFRDTLEIGREGRYDIYDLFLVLAEPLVERRLRLEVPERLDARGEVLVPLDEAALRAVCAQFQAENIEAVAISFLHAYSNPSHERRAAEIIRQLWPDVAISQSHEVASELREYERTSTTVANAYVQPLTARYLQRLETGLQAAGLQAPLHIMLSNGGTCAVKTAAAFPVRLVESGPCGGALAAAHWGRQAGFESVLAFDMGGTTAKAILSHQGHFPITTESEVARVHRFKRGSGLSLLVPVLDIIEIGAGGGSIAHLNELKLPEVGPGSAGASPGPACYGLGGQRPTVTDADLLLGYLNPDYFLGGQMQLEVAGAQAAVAGLARVLDMDVTRMAWGIHQLVNENMAAAARVHAAERGLDIRLYAMVATGGAGPVHACGVAQRLGLKTVVVPPAAGVGSAFGLLLAPISFDFARSYVTRLETLDVERVNALFEQLEAEGKRIVSAAGVPDSQIQVTRMADMRYVGQGHEIRVPVRPDRLDEAAHRNLQEAFDREYRRIYGRLCAGVTVEAIHWRVTVSGPQPDTQQVQVIRSETAETQAAQKGTRSTLFDPDRGPVETPIYARTALPGDFTAGGPAIIEEIESTTVVPPGWSVKLDATANLILSAQLS
jgi:N-methylhydantoinase A/oxoprolinase/acetone carboxylase beta subunit